jgi:hypothetical protein
MSILLIIYSPCLQRIVCDTDFSYTLLNLYDPLPQQNENSRTKQERITTWKSKTLRRRLPFEIQTTDVDKIASKDWSNPSR